MKLEVKTIDNKQKIIIVAGKTFSLVKPLKKYLEKLGGEVFYSSSFPKFASTFEIGFVINQKILAYRSKTLFKKTIFIFINQRQQADRFLEMNLDNVKIININGDIITEELVDKILWFSFSRTKEKQLTIYTKKENKPSKSKFLKPSFNFTKILKFKNLIVLFLCIFLLIHIFFLVPLTITSYASYLSFINLKNERLDRVTDWLKWQTLFFSLTKKTYSLAHPTLLFLSLAHTPDDLIEINDSINKILNKVLSSQKAAKEIVGLILKKEKTTDEKKLLVLRLDLLKSDLDEVGDDLTIISNKLPLNLPQITQIKKTVLDSLDLISQTKKVIPYFENILATTSEKKYLLLFANNMELRPGGGFIGSFGTLTIKDYTLAEINIYDVYDADGQLKAHIEPPTAIREYLNQPHWFLRDSAFSPDFPENYQQAKFFLEKELSLTNFSCSILITTSAIENILDAFGELYLPDFKEKINKNNFYLKVQYYAEKNFFPGSIQKKTFLSSLTQQILLNFNTISLEKLIRGFKKSLDEKQLVIYIDDPAQEKLFDSLFWSGRIISPKCLNNKSNCIVDFLMPVDANLGVNKANFFISRLITLKTNFSAAGEINHQLSVVFKNESPADVFPGGSYKNYFQVYLPQNIDIKTITKNGVLVDKESIVDEIKKEGFRVVGLFFSVEPKKTVEIKIDYRLINGFQKGDGTYQLIVQKQIGSANNDFISEIYLTKNYYLLSQNFIPLVKDNQILYNTYLSTDKIFFIELMREKNE